MGERILVTGGLGFIGRYLCRELLEHGYEVRVLDSMVEQVHGPVTGHETSDRIDTIVADIRDSTSLRRALDGVGGVFHLAAEVGVGQSMYEIERYVGANDLGTAALRLFNVFGPGQALSNPYTGVLANFASRLINGNPPLIFEDGRQRRDFVHVKDVARAFRLAMERPEAAGQIINVASGRSYTIAQIARHLAAAVGLPDIQPEILHKARAGDIRHCFADISKARSILGFQPAYALEDSLEELADWVATAQSVDHGLEMRRQLEAKGLVS